VSAAVVPAMRRLLVKPVGQTWSPALAMHMVKPVALGTQRSNPEHPMPVFVGRCTSDRSSGPLRDRGVGVQLRGPLGLVTLAKPALLGGAPMTRSFGVATQAPACCVQARGGLSREAHAVVAVVTVVGAPATSARCRPLPVQEHGHACVAGRSGLEIADPVKPIGHAGWVCRRRRRAPSYREQAARTRTRTRGRRSPSSRCSRCRCVVAELGPDFTQPAVSGRRRRPPSPPPSLPPASPSSNVSSGSELHATTVSATSANASSYGAAQADRSSLHHGLERRLPCRWV